MQFPLGKSWNMCPKIEYQNLMVESIMAFIFAMEIAILVAVSIFQTNPHHFKLLLGHTLCVLSFGMVLLSFLLVSHIIPRLYLVDDVVKPFLCGTSLPQHDETNHPSLPRL